MSTGFNHQVAQRLHEAADLLEEQSASPFRVRAYRRAAQTIEELEQDLREVIERDGAEGLVALPTIGRGVAAAIVELAARGRWTALERLRGETDPEALFQGIPGIGPALARRLHDHLHVDTLEALESAAHDGQVEGVPGLGRRRARAIRDHLDSTLSRLRRQDRAPGAVAAAPRPSVASVLRVDAEYREGAARGALPTIAPRRFNPEGKAWLPILHTSHGGWHFTALFSNTARAHELGRTHDWVVLYFYDDEHHEGQQTVVTEGRGPLAGKRVVRGREQECRAHYARELSNP
jgi:putative hydrolase